MMRRRVVVVELMLLRFLLFVMTMTLQPLKKLYFDFRYSRLKSLRHSIQPFSYTYYIDINLFHVFDKKRNQEKECIQLFLLLLCTEIDSFIRVFNRELTLFLYYVCGQNLYKLTWLTW